MEAKEQPWKNWVLSDEFLTKSKLKKFAARHPDETYSMLSNLDQQLEVLNNTHATTLLNMETTYCHREGFGLYAMGQASGRTMKESRLYFFPDDSAKVIWILDVGTKESQKRDVPRLQKFIRTYLKKG